MINAKIGIYYVALGEPYDYQCAHSVKLIRKYSDIPIRVITNLVANQRCIEWDSLSNVSFEEVNATRNKNRYYKIRPDLFSPFDITMFCDADSAVQSPEFLTGFDKAQNHDVIFSVLQRFENIGQRLPMPGLYCRFIKAEDYPATIYRSGVFFFRKTKNTKRLFEAWESYWRLLGCGRDMPALFVAAARNKDLSFGILPPGWDNKNGHVIVHAGADEKVKGLPVITKYKPDNHNQSEWSENPSCKCHYCVNDLLPPKSMENK